MRHVLPNEFPNRDLSDHQKYIESETKDTMGQSAENVSAKLITICCHALLAMIQSFFHNAILFIDISDNAWYKQAHWLIGAPYLSIIASKCSTTVSFNLQSLFTLFDRKWGEWRSSSWTMTPTRTATASPSPSSVMVTTEGTSWTGTAARPGTPSYLWGNSVTWRHWWGNLRSWWSRAVEDVSV